MPHPQIKQLAGILACPACGNPLLDTSASQDETQNSKPLQCGSCGTQHFSLANTPCLFPSGEQYKQLWQHQLAMMIKQGEESLCILEEDLCRNDLSDTSKARIQAMIESAQLSQSTSVGLCKKAGLKAENSTQFAQMEAGNLAEYNDLILRDWAWSDCHEDESEEEEDDENQLALMRVLSALKDKKQDFSNILMLGSGAGRLSWDLHRTLKPKCSIALDSNPILLLIGDELVCQQQTLDYAELKLFPQMDFKASHNWRLQAPTAENDDLHKSWFPLAANVWQPPFVREQFDLIVTSWFIDVNGGDVRDLIGLISQLLAPGGQWINTGPLLYTRHMPYHQKYHHQEIKEFLALSGLELNSEHTEQAAHLASPIEARAQIEELWTFGVSKTKAGQVKRNDEQGPPAWLIMHHMPIPIGNYQTPQDHPLIDFILSKLDGQHSINDLTHLVAPQLPNDVSAKEAVVTLLGDIVLGQ
jgi:uncharacterized protein YbaR (Trm112 family)